MAVIAPLTVYTYQVNKRSNAWINNGRLDLPSAFNGADSYISMQNDILVATFTDKNDHPSVCGYTYKLSKTPNCGDEVLHKWTPVATLTAKTDPLTKFHILQGHTAVSVEGKLAFIGRFDCDPRFIGYFGTGKVFVFDLSNV